MKRPIINLDRLTLERHAHGERFEVQDGAIAPVIGAKQLGYCLAVVPPGKRAYPFHCHHVNEEMFFVLEGHGTLVQSSRAPRPDAGLLGGRMNRWTPRVRRGVLVARCGP